MRIAVVARVADVLLGKFAETARELPLVAGNDALRNENRLARRDFVSNPCGAWKIAPQRITMRRLRDNDPGLTRRSLIPLNNVSMMILSHGTRPGFSADRERLDAYTNSKVAQKTGVPHCVGAKNTSIG